jgi:hypothetical protein
MPAQGSDLDAAASLVGQAASSVLSNDPLKNAAASIASQDPVGQAASSLGQAASSILSNDPVQAAVESILSQDPVTQALNQNPVVQLLLNSLQGLIAPIQQKVQVSSQQRNCLWFRKLLAKPLHAWPLACASGPHLLLMRGCPQSILPDLPSSGAPASGPIPAQPRPPAAAPLPPAPASPLPVAALATQAAANTNFTHVVPAAALLDSDPTPQPQQLATKSVQLPSYQLPVQAASVPLITKAVGGAPPIIPGRRHLSQVLSFPMHLCCVVNNNAA